jgi:hypothetical protein
VERVGLRPPVAQNHAEEGEVVLEACHAINNVIISYRQESCSS